MEMGCACSMHGGSENAYYILVGNLKGRDCLRPRHMSEVDVKMDLKETGSKIVYWIHLRQFFSQLSPVL
jgi:hypothetical protein